MTFPMVKVCSIRLPKNVNIATIKDYNNSKSVSTLKLTPSFKKQPKSDTPKLPPDLSEIVTVWPSLPEYIKAAIKALIQTA